MFKKLTLLSVFCVMLVPSAQCMPAFSKHMPEMPSVKKAAWAAAVVTSAAVTLGSAALAAVTGTLFAVGKQPEFVDWWSHPSEWTQDGLPMTRDQAGAWCVGIYAGCLGVVCGSVALYMLLKGNDVQQKAQNPAVNYF